MPSVVEIETTAGAPDAAAHVHGRRYVFEADMGQPAGIRQVTLRCRGRICDGDSPDDGNPQLVVLGALPTDETFARLGPALERHAEFQAGRTSSLRWSNRGTGCESASGNVEWDRPSLRDRFVRCSRGRRGPRRRRSSSRGDRTRREPGRRMDRRRRAPDRMGRDHLRRTFEAAV